jgi:hypothetical protein
MSTLAVFLLLAGGTALAAGGLRKNSVNSRTVKNNSLLSADVKNGTVSGADVADGSLSGADVADGTLGGAKIADGSLGGAQIADGSLGGADIGSGKAGIGPANLSANAIDSSNVIDGSLQGTDLGADTLTGIAGTPRGEIAESTLGQVPSATALVGVGPNGLISSRVYEVTGVNTVGESLGDGTVVLSVACEPGDRAISGGPVDTNTGENIVESFGTSASWFARVRPPQGGDEFSVNAICADTSQ